MSTITVSNAAQLSSALNSAKSGDVIRLEGGNYGDFVINSKVFSSDITITSVDEGNPAVFHSLSVRGSENIVIQNIDVNFTATASTASFSSAVMVDKSSGITFLDGNIKGSAAITGVSANATQLDASGNVIGYPAGRGMTIQNSSDVTVQGSDISNLHRGVIVTNSGGVEIKGNEIHHLRASAIVGGGDDLVIEGNYLHSANPWRIGEPGGDHADFIALWTDPNQTGPTTNVIVRDNVLDQGDGHRILGMWLQGLTKGFSGVLIEGNAILGGDHQGIYLRDVVNGKVVDNVMLQTTSYDKAPGIILAEGVAKVVVSENTAWSVADKNGGATGNVLSDNDLIQKTSPLDVGYYDSILIGKLAGLVDADAIRAFVSESLGLGAGDGGLSGGGLGSGGPIGGGVVEPGGDVGGGGIVIEKPSPLPLPSVPSEGVQGLSLSGDWRADTLSGSGGNDTLDGRGGADLLLGGDGDDTYYVPNSLVKLFEQPGQGFDTVIAKGDFVLGANFENLTVSDAAKNNWSATGNELNNVITGNEGNNKLDGALGDDTLYGGVGNDVLIGGVGNDRLTGGDGTDVFRFAPGSGNDLITDFGTGGRDTIDVLAYFKVGAKVSVVDAGEDTVLHVSSGETITLIGVDSQHLTATYSGFIYT